MRQDGEEKQLANPNHAALKAFDAASGRQLYQSGDAMASWVHCSGIAVAVGRVFAVGPRFQRLLLRAGRPVSLLTKFGTN